MGRMVSRKLREQGLRAPQNGRRRGHRLLNWQRQREADLKEVYRILALTLGVPPTEFTWTRKGQKDGNVVQLKGPTRLSNSIKEFAGNDLKTTM